MPKGWNLHFAALLAQEGHDFVAMLRRREPAGGFAVIVASVDVGPALQQKAHNIEVAALRDVSFRVVKAVDRCVLTTIDPTTLERGHEPIRTLARHRRRDGRTWFAMHLVPQVGGVVRVGDEVTPGR